MERQYGSTLALFATAGLTLAGLTAGALQAPDPPKPATLHEAARKRHDRVSSYIARLTRRESPRGRQGPEEVVLLKVRERPWSVYAKWLGKEGRGREGVYVRGEHDNKVHTKLAAGDVPFMPAGRRMALAPDGALMRAASTHPITDLGIGSAIEKIGEVVAAKRRGERRLGEVEAVGPRKRKEFKAPAYGLEHKIPAGVDRALPSGGRRTYWLDPATGLPTVIVTRDGDGREVEYYHYDRLQLSARLDDEDFDPDELWGAPAAKGRGR